MDVPGRVLVFLPVMLDTPTHRQMFISLPGLGLDVALDIVLVPLALWVWMSSASYAEAIHFNNHLLQWFGLDLHLHDARYPIDSLFFY
jgi:hypothetical protein